MRENNPCRFSQVCGLYQKEAETCRDEYKAVNYYGPGRPCGCFRRNQEKARGYCKEAGPC